MERNEPVVYNGETVTSPANRQQPAPGDPCHTLTDDSRNYVVYENHSQDSRYKELGDVSETVSAKYGTGGNNQPIVLESNQNHATVTDSGVVNTLPSAMGQGGGYVPMVVSRRFSDVRVSESDISPTIEDGAGSGGNNVPMVMDVYQHHGWRENETCGPLTCGQNNTIRGDTPLVVEPVPIEGNGQRESHRGDGYGNSGDPMFTLNSTEHHAVAYGLDKAMTTGGNCTAGGDCVHEEYTPPLTTDRPHAVAYGIDQQGGKGGANYSVEKSPPILSDSHGTPHAVAYGISPYASNAMLSDNPNSGIYEADTSRTLDLNGGSPACNQGGIAIVQDGNVEAVCVGNGQLNQMSMAEQANTLDTMHDQQAVCVQNTGRGWWNESEVGATLRTPCGGDSTKANLVCAVDCRNGTEDAETNGTLQAKDGGGTSLNLNNVCRAESVVRRLTPKECERLQGFPDGWTDIGEWIDTKGKKHKDADSPRYKALGNSIAVGYANNQSGFWCWLARRICAQYERQVTMASLFDGIGGFPLAFQSCGAVPVWASEIEEFPIAVTKIRFPE